MHDELQQQGFSVVAIAFDDSADAVRPFTEGITMPVLLDREHLISELLAISNVPTVVWVDADGRIAIRRVLRKLRRDADAMMVFLEVRRETFDSVGDDQFIPRPLATMTARTVPVLEPRVIR